jgi:hypothetical protein
MEDKRESEGGVLGSAAPCQFGYLRYEYIGGGAGGGSPRPDPGGKRSVAGRAGNTLDFNRGGAFIG